MTPIPNHAPNAPVTAQRVIRVLDKDIPLGAYVAGVRAAIAAPEASFRHGLTTWWSTTGAEIREQFRRGMHERINAGVPYSARGVSG